ncbi:hypothetical protein E8L90_23725 [Brevibacillus antibioticus]|uniref:Integrase n=1 Tax=Brevibacillus antibioticus TaxID=2570228 RepID=A0A4V5TJ63_9BACL|nr:site-specific integrase [Brevibacillus antibioticus]TKI58153.1 hypothetical protein E8L90_23725 [Brevibacillus antibioticus]
MKKNDCQRDHENCLARYLKNCKQFSMPDKSINTRKSAIKKFLTFLEEKNKKIGEATHLDIEEFLEDERDNETSLSTINNYYAFLKGFFAFCREYGDNKTLDFSKVNFSLTNAKNIELFSDEEIDEVFSIISLIKKDSVRIRDDLMISLLLFTGCTLRELHSLNVYTLQKTLREDDDYCILLNEQLILFRSNSLRKIKVPELIIEKIKEYRNQVLNSNTDIEELKEGTALFLSTYGEKKGGFHRINYSTLQDRMSQIKKKSRFKDRKVSIKNIRHTVISKLVNSSQRLDLVSEIVGLDIASLKYYIEDQSSFEEEIRQLTSNYHPFKSYFSQ